MRHWGEEHSGAQAFQGLAFQEGEAFQEGVEAFQGEEQTFYFNPTKYTV